jgi:ribose transport system permease protein
MRKRIKFEQEFIVFALAVVLFVIFALTLPGFLTAANLVNLVRNVSVLGILGVGMAIVIIGRGIDLSIVANMAISVAWAAKLMSTGLGPDASLLVGLGFALVMSLATGILVAYVEIPPLFATLAMGTFIYGFGHFALIGADLVYLAKEAEGVRFFGSGRVLGIPTSVLMLIAVCLCAYVLLARTKLGRYIYATGDNQLAARITGLPVRPLIVFQYLISGVVAFAAGFIMLAAVTSMDTRIANSTLIYDVILVAVLGGVGLSGGKGRVRNVIVGTMLVGTLFDGLTIMNIPYTEQNIVKAVILLAAIVLDGVVNPRDEQTTQQGDI